MGDKETALEHEAIVGSVRRWLDAVVVALDLCPFAHRELAGNRVRFAVTDATTETQLLTALRNELTFLSDDASTETTLLIHPNVLDDFHDYNEFLADADALLVEMDWEGVYQIASFHPRYQFAGTQVDDAENYTNRSPYPMLHLLREASVSQAVDSHPDPESIPEHNVALLKSMGREEMQARLAACFQ